jgi:cytochrome c biogenesis protein CcmG/thiol:disulfide interchange protein DsbE
VARPLLYLPPLVFAAIAAGFFLGMRREDPDALQSALVGLAAPPVTLAPLGDRPLFDAAALDAPGVKLVNYWASWCAPCRAEHPNLEMLAAEGIPIYGINYKDEPARAEAFLEELGDPYGAIGADESGRTAIDWGLYGVPETFVIDGEGRVVLRFAGPITERTLKDRIRPAIEQALD